MPKSKLDFWRPKLEGNRERDLRNQEMLKKLGWHVLVVWECEVENIEKVSNKVREFLQGREGKYEIG
ncbi:MAG: hypothetical protein Tsb0017_21490 [Geothermobacteraceae bacterium]